MSELKSGSYGEYAERKLLNGNIVELLAKSENIEAVHIVVEPGKTLGKAHVHQGQEFKFVVKGTVEFNIDGVKKILGAGGWLLHDCESPHSVANNTSQKAEYITIAVPPGCMAVK